MMKWTSGLIALAMMGAVGCAQSDAELEEEWVGASSAALGETGAALTEGRRLFVHETFGGNGRTCQTCHSIATGTLTLAQIDHLYRTHPDDELFQHDALDDDGVGVSRIRSEGTIRITLTLPWYVTNADDPGNRQITVFRGIPSTLNTPGLDPALMYDLRNPTLEDQALGAINAHAVATVAPTPEQLGLIADFQQIAPRFYSSFELFRFSRGGPAPTLPPGRTASERRGRRMFVDAPFNPPSRDGICALCHSGPMLNLTNEHGAAIFPAPVGTRFHPLFISDPAHGTNHLNRHVYNLLVDDGLGNIVPVATTDPGVLLNEAVLPPPFILPRNTFAGFFKTPQLWGVEDTSPYFHDNSAADLRAVLDQYEVFFRDDPFIGGQITLTEQDKQDAIAYLRLLR
ncbi:MAG: hypothetical protein AB7S26_19215 [Sandaracinaceae bacterium]